MQINTTISGAISSILPKIRRLAERLDWKNAEDITQEVALKLLKAAPTENQLEHAGWLNKVVRNTAIDRWRFEKREAQYLDRSLSLDLSGSVCEGPDERKLYTPYQAVAEDMETYLMPIIREKLQEIPKSQRQALVLSSAGFSYSEIADITGATLGTVRSRIHYARKRAQKLLAPVLK